MAAKNPSSDALILSNGDNTNPITQEDQVISTKPSFWQVWWPRLRLAIAVFLPVFLETLDYTVVAAAQTNIASIFNQINLQSYIGTAYVLGSTVFLPISASFADVFGRYGAMQASILIFLVGSALSTGATNMPILLLGRGISGVGAAGLLGIVRILLSDSENLDDNNIQNAVMVVVYTAGFSSGPSIGAVLLGTHWRWVFGINLPIAVASMIIMHLLISKHCKGPQPPQRLQRLPPTVASSIQSQITTGFIGGLQRMDLIGALLFIILGILILLGLNWGSTEGWNQLKVILCLVLGGVFLLFVLWEYVVDHSTDHLAKEEEYLLEETVGDVVQQRTADEEDHRPPPVAAGIRARLARITPEFVRVTDPILPMNMFRSYDVLATDFATMTHGMVMLGIFYFVATFYVIVNGESAVGSGVQLLYFAPGMGIGAVVSIVLIKLFRQPRVTIVFGSVILPIGIAFLAQAMYTGNEKQIKGFMIMSGVGIGVAFGPLAYQARFTQPEDRVAIVVASNLFFRIAGGTIGLAQLSAVMNSRARTYIYNAAVSGRITPAQAALISLSLNSVDSSGGGIYSLPEELISVITDAFRDGLRAAFFSLLPWLAVGLVMCLFLSKVSEERMDGKKARQSAERANDENAPSHNNNHV
ncbi:hypothetical protein FRC17_004286 [Serendipita sp. 399]|nr:hypothetical protein FRC17_004286 [Serendipita sp. 399]